MTSEQDKFLAGLIELEKKEGLSKVGAAWLCYTFENDRQKVIDILQRALNQGALINIPKTMELYDKMRRFSEM
jgi:hypothetical protein